MLGAYAAATGMVALDSLDAAVTASLPSYRSQHVARNVAAIRTGFEFAPRDLSPAWPDAGAMVASMSEAGA
jgi:Pyruvate/2-oxoacid:ferredoxin oxidoreductase gamma subunit